MNLNEIEKILQVKLRESVSDALDKSEDILKEKIQGYYDDYEPQVYKRTDTFKNSIDKSEVLSTGNTAKGTLKIDINSMSYSKKSTSPQKIVDSANAGLHGGQALGSGGSHFWDEALPEIENTVQQLGLEVIK